MRREEKIVLTERLERFYQGLSDDAYTFMGAHPMEGRDGFSFRVWAPCAKAVFVVGDFNFWNVQDLPMEKDAHGSWYAESTFARDGQRYQFFVVGKEGKGVYKTDPYARRVAPLPDTAGILCKNEPFPWTDFDWIHSKTNPLYRPINIYEVHALSWKKHPDGRHYSYTELKKHLIPYVKKMGYTHVEFLPLTEYPFEGSWGYQVSGYFAPTHRLGSPEEFKALINAFHKEGIGVILDWVPAHFPKDESGLFEFDGSYCYEKRDPAMNEHKGWGTRIFDWGRFEVQSFLVSSALFWLREYHIDGLRVDAVASMLYLDYCRDTFTPNPFGGNWDLDAIEFFKKLNTAAFRHDPSALMIAEESTAFPMVTRPPEMGGLGFNLKWNMGWMNDILDYMETDPLFRKGKHNTLTFSHMYAFSENYILPLSHDEVVHLKKSMMEKMPGTYEERFASLRLLYGYMLAHPGGKLNFMGNEIGQFREWSEKRELDWSVLTFPSHIGLHNYLKELNRFYREEGCLWERSFDPDGFQWISADDRDNGVIAFLRKDNSGNSLVCIFNFTPVWRENYKLGVPTEQALFPVFHSDKARFGGSGRRAKKAVPQKEGMHGFAFSASFTIPPLSALFYQQKNTKNS